MAVRWQIFVPRQAGRTCGPRSVARAPDVLHQASLWIPHHDGHLEHRSARLVVGSGPVPNVEVDFCFAGHRRSPPLRRLGGFRVLVGSAELCWQERAERDFIRRELNPVLGGIRAEVRDPMEVPCGWRGIGMEGQTIDLGGVRRGTPQDGVREADRLPATSGRGWYPSGRKGIACFPSACRAWVAQRSGPESSRPWRAMAEDPGVGRGRWEGETPCSQRLSEFRFRATVRRLEHDHPLVPARSAHLGQHFAA